MKIPVHFNVFYLLLILFSLFFSITAEANKAVLIEVKGAIGPASFDYIKRNLEKATEEKADFIILNLDTPGGLETSMREINKAILASSLPIVTYVAPSGARAASAGTFIVYASHIAAMAPGTNIGAASPVNISDKQQSTMNKKSMNDAAAYIRSLAALRGRNSDWGEKAVTQGLSVSANQAAQMKIIDFVAADLPDLLNKLNDRKVNLQGHDQTIDTKDVTVTLVKPDWRYQLLSIITDPSIAYILFLLGIYGLFFELYNPGFVLPGVFGSIALVLALYAFQLLPVNYAGFTLLLLGITLIVAEVFVASFGVLGIGGVIAFTLGSIFLMDSSVPGFSIAWQIILAMSIVTIAFFLMVIHLAVSSKRKKVVSGKEALIQKEGVVLEYVEGKAWIRVNGEMWQAYSDQPLHLGQRVRIIKMTDLSMIVEPIEKKGE